MQSNTKSHDLSEGLRFYFYPHLYSIIDRERTGFIVSNIKGKKVLDAGSGRGNIALCARRAGHDVIAVDLSKSSLNEAAFLFRHERVKIPLIETSITNLPLGSKTFDTIICADVIEHIPEVSKALSELRRVLKDNGKLIISLPNAMTFGFFYDHIVTRFISEKKQTPFAYKRYFKITDKEISQFRWNKKIIYGHCQYFTLKKISRALNSAKFKINSVKNWRFLNPYIRSLGTLLGIGPIKLMERLDLALARHIPHQLAADWIFICEKDRESDGKQSDFRFENQDN